MRKQIILSFIIMFCFMFAVWVMAASKVELVGQQILDVPAKIVHGRTLAPIRFVCNAFRKIIDWDSHHGITCKVFAARDANNSDYYMEIIYPDQVWKRMADNWVCVKSATLDYGWVYDPEGALNKVSQTNFSLSELINIPKPISPLSYSQYKKPTFPTTIDFNKALINSESACIVISRADFGNPKMLSGGSSIIGVLVLNHEKPEFINSIRYFSAYGGDNGLMGLPDIGDLVVDFNDDYCYGWITIAEPEDRQDIFNILKESISKEEYETEVNDLKSYALEFKNYHEEEEQPRYSLLNYENI